MTNNLPVDIICPLPPSKSGIADYSSELLAELSRYWDIRVVVNEAAELDYQGPRQVQVVDWAKWRAGPQRPVRVIHAGNNPDHDYCYQEACQGQAIVVLHDFNLHHLIAHLTLATPGGPDWDAYTSILRDAFGEDGAVVADGRKYGQFREFQQFLLPLNRPVLARARGAIVHSAWAREQLARLFPSLPVVRIPHHFSDLQLGGVMADRAKAKESFGIDPSKAVISAIGLLTPPKQFHLTLRALGLIRDRLPPFHVLLAGEPQDEAWLKTQMEESGVADRVTVTGYQPIERLQDAAIASDVVSSLRYPTCGESSGVLIRSMGLGRCCLVFRYGAFKDYPEDTLVSAPLETEDPRVLAEVLLSILNDPLRRRDIELKASAYIREVHDLRRSAQAYDAGVRSIFAARGEALPASASRQG